MRRLSKVLQEEYGEKVYKLSLNSGCTCPNRDGAVSVGGCAFCSEGGSGEFAPPFLPIEEQIQAARHTPGSLSPIFSPSPTPTAISTA